MLYTNWGNIMNTYSFIPAMIACIIHAYAMPIAFGKDNPEAKTIIARFPASYSKKTKVFKLIVNEDNKMTFYHAFNVIEPIQSAQANRSKKKDAIIDAIESGMKDIPSYFKEQHFGTYNENDAAYAQYFADYLAWKNAQFTILYVLTAPKKGGDMEILGMVTAFATNAEPSEVIIKQVYTADMLVDVQWKGIKEGNLVDAITNMIHRKDAEDITSLPTIPSRIQQDAIERVHLSNIVKLGRNDIDAYRIGEKEFQLIHAVLTPPLPTMTSIASKSNKKDLIIEAIEEGESDIAMFVRSSSGGILHNSDREFARYQQLISHYMTETFESAFILTKRNAKSIEILALLLNNTCMPLVQEIDCLQKTKKIMLAKELQSHGIGPEQVPLLQYLQEIINNKACKKVYP